MQLLYTISILVIISSEASPTSSSLAEKDRKVPKSQGDQGKGMRNLLNIIEIM